MLQLDGGVLHAAVVDINAKDTVNVVQREACVRRVVFNDSMNAVGTVSLHVETHTDH